MEPTALHEWQFTEEEKKTLLELALTTIEHGVERGIFKSVASHFPGQLSESGASFVTLRRQGQLRGCIGQLEASMPLAQDVCKHAYAAAFQDPRFSPLQANELADLDIHISVLSPKVPVECESENQLLTQLQPGQDGVVLRAGYRQGTFLPDVWRSLPEPRNF